MRRRHRVVLFVLAFLPSTLLAQAPTLEECERRVRESPADPGSYYCFLLAARGHGAHEAAARSLESIWRAHPERHRALLNLAVIEQDLGHERAGDLYAAAASAAAGAGDAWGVVYARTGRANWLRARGAIAAADEELIAAQGTAEVQDDPIMLAHVLASRGVAALAAADPGLALRLYRRAESMVLPDGPAYLRSWILSGLGGVCWRLQDHWGALSIYDREADLLRETGDTYGLSMSLVNRALAALALVQAGQFDPAEHERFVREALDAAIDGRNRYEEARARTQLGLILEGQAAIEQFERARALARDLGDLETEALSLRLAAREHAATGEVDRRDEAERLVARSLERALAAGDTLGTIGALFAGAEIARLYAPRDEFIARSMEVVVAAERLRSLQKEPDVRARVFAGASEAHAWLATWLIATLDASEDPDGDLAAAFDLLERRRAREILETLAEIEGGPGTVLVGSLSDRLEGIWDAIADRQRRLLDAGQPADARGAVQAELAALDAQEYEIVESMAAENPVVAAATVPRVATLKDVQAMLAVGQAMIYFAHGTARRGSMQMGGAGSWLLVLTREQARALPIPEELDLAGPLSVYRGLVEARDPIAAEAGARIYAMLLAGAVDALPAGVTRLVIVPEHDLADVPLASLAPRPGEPTLAERFDVTLAASATLWARWRAVGGQVPGSVLSMALPAASDRVLPVGETGENGESWRGGPLPRLSETKREAESVVRAIGRGSARMGAEVSKAYLESVDPASYGVLHLATHALIDTHRLDRSFILLSPDVSAEDGHLGAREIADLRLRGKIVILSACGSATGEPVRGEGLMGLAHAFFRAGVRSVVGTLWRVRDDEAADLVALLASGLGRGRTLAASLAEAQRTMIRRGAPPAAWAGFVVIGDGDAILAVGPAPGRPGARPIVVVAALLVLGSLTAFRLARRRGRS